MELEISPLAAPDLSEVFEINNITGSTEWSFGLFEAELSAPNRINLVVRSDSKSLIGFILSSYVADELTVLAVAVAPTVQRRGVAKTLYNEAVKLAMRAGCRRAYLEVRRSNQGAQAFYRSCGFEQTGIRAGYYPQPNAEDAIQMGVDLPNA